ncbi:PqqD family protein [Streptomyces roseoverticillatus]|uniref:PqqD family protein n=1 Tax=Streptomyces roseoverticillatus TaxID=66429 RepID=UPI0004C221FE|nr:PqqD family protein [Streptomyces roseoverticillatus]
MPLIGLARHVVFDDTDGAGVILDTRRGVYLSLNVTATHMLRTALACDSVAAAVARLREDFDADEETLAAGLAGLTARLGEHALLEKDGSTAAPRRRGRRREGR